MSRRKKSSSLVDEIMANLTSDWQPITELIIRLGIYGESDIRSLQSELKKLVRKALVLEDKIKGKNQWKLNPEYKEFISDQDVFELKSYLENYDKNSIEFKEISESIKIIEKLEKENEELKKQHIQDLANKLIICENCGYRMVIPYPKDNSCPRCHISFKERLEQMEREEREERKRLSKNVEEKLKREKKEVVDMLERARVIEKRSLSEMTNAIYRGKKLIDSMKFDSALEMLKDNLKNAKKLRESENKDKMLKQIYNLIDEVYLGKIKESIREGTLFKSQSDYSNALKQFEKGFELIKLFRNIDYLVKFESVLTKLINDIKTTIIKNSILELGSKFGRLQVIEIAEECGESSDLIITTIKKMIEEKEIYAKFFESSQAVAFDQQKILKNLQKLKVSIISESQDKCIVCRGKLSHLFYECPQCKAAYHVKCANALKAQGKDCFNCQTPFPISPIKTEIKDAPIILSVQEISDQLTGFLHPDEIRHKDLTAEFKQLKSNLRDELIHKVSQQFYNDFSSQIEDIFGKISELSTDKLSLLDQLKSEQRELFNDITKELEEYIISKERKVKKVKTKCNNCGKDILKEEEQEICEYCGEKL